MRGQQDEIIWGNVERIRSIKKWKYTDLATAMSMTTQAINSLKKGGIGKRSLKKLARALNVSEGELLKPVDASIPVAPEGAVTVRDLLDMQRELSKIQGMIIDLGKEIGEIKTRMIDAAQTGDINRLGIVGGKGK